jgi:thioredoxin-dependent peroxiredoxin
MSKKTRNKSPKSSIGRTTRARPAASAKRPPSRSRKAPAGNPGKNAKKRQPGSAVLEASHKPPSKALKLSSSAKTARSTAPGSKAKAVTAKPAKAEAVKAETSNPSLDNARAAPAVRSALAEGAKAPSFRLPRDGGNTVSLADYAGKKLVLFFYPRADTPGCTKEAIDFTRLASTFAENQTSVLGVSGDPPKTQEAFRNKHQLSIPLVSDEKHETLRAYGAWGEKSMYGRTFQGILRTTILIGADGRVAKIWRNVRVDGHADEVLAATRAT